MLVAEKRNYRVLNVQEAKAIAFVWLQQVNLENAISFGLPEVDDRYHIWRVPLLNHGDNTWVGEVVIDARTSLIVQEKSTEGTLLEARLLGRCNGQAPKKTKPSSTPYALSTLRNIIAQGDSEELLQELPAKSVDLVFTSPPYYNARPEYSDFITYEDYMLKIRKVIQQVHRVLAEGRFFVMNIAPVLIRRASRNESSRRIAVPFDMHRVFLEEGFTFIDDIIWEKPEGAGWATSRGRRFAADRNPLQYKPVPVTEYILVYRKQTTQLIDWHIRCHPRPDIVQDSRIGDGYERTNIWRIQPAYDKRHPAIFPMELAEKVIGYYSFREDVVLDPFAGIGTVGRAAAKLSRRFVLMEQNEQYVEHIREDMVATLGRDAAEVLTMNCAPLDVSQIML